MKDRPTEVANRSEDSFLDEDKKYTSPTSWQNTGFETVRDTAAKQHFISTVYAVLHECRSPVHGVITSNWSADLNICRKLRAMISPPML